MNAYNPSTWEAEARGTQIWGQPGLNSEAVPQKKGREEVGDMAQVVKHLASKHQALSSNSVLQGEKKRVNRYKKKHLTDSVFIPNENSH
jgi:uncharacterized protein YaiL (DUF2058 family)